MTVRTYINEYDTDSIASMVVFIDDLKKQIAYVNKILVPMCDELLANMENED